MSLDYIVVTHFPVLTYSQFTAIYVNIKSPATHVYGPYKSIKHVITPQNPIGKGMTTVFYEYQF